MATAGALGVLKGGSLSKPACLASPSNLLPQLLVEKNLFLEGQQEGERRTPNPNPSSVRRGVGTAQGRGTEL